MTSLKYYNTLNRGNYSINKGYEFQMNEVWKDSEDQKFTEL